MAEEMYNAKYHPLKGDNLKNVLDGHTPEEQEEIKEQVELATKAKLRKYRITVVPPDSDGLGGVWYEVDNGIVTGSCNQ